LTYDEAKDWIFDHLPDYVPPEQEFAKFIFPVIRNMTAPGLIQDLVAVQPMQGPPMTIFYKDFVRDPWWKRWWRKISRLGSSVSRARD
jgi:hypothetical protein